MSIAESNINSASTQNTAFGINSNHIPNSTCQQSSNTDSKESRSPKISLFDRIIELNSMDDEYQAVNQLEKDLNFMNTQQHLNYKDNN